MMKRILYILLINLCCITAKGQRTLNLNDCLSLALENNIRIKNARLEIDGAKDAQQEVFTRFFPNVSAMGTTYWADKGILEMELMPGMDLSLLKNGVIGRVSAFQPLYMGGQIFNSNKLASLNIEAQNLLLKQAHNEVHLTTEQCYWQYILFSKKLETLNLIEQLIGNTYREVEAMVKSGVTHQNDLLQVKLKESEIVSNKLQVKNAIKYSKMLLGQHIGLSVDSFLVENIIYHDLALPVDYQVVHEEALYETVASKLNQKQVEIAKLQTKIERGKYLPSLGVGAGYMYHNLLDKSHSFGMVYATISIPISRWWGGKHAVNRKKRQEKIAQLNMENVNELLLIEMQHNYDELEVSYGQVKISQQSVKNASENVRVNNEYFKAGTVNLTNLLDAQTILQQAHYSLVEKYTEYLMKLSKYMILTNSNK